jgi:hypothetical protein
MKVGDLVKVRMKWGQPTITGIVCKMWHNRLEWVYEVRNIKSGLLTHATEMDMEVVSATR